jgi:hypothetical protein
MGWAPRNSLVLACPSTPENIAQDYLPPSVV